MSGEYAESIAVSEAERLRHRVLILGPSNIGDGLLVADIVAAMSRHFPHSHMTLVLGDRAGQIFEDDPRVHTLINMELYEGASGRLKLMGMFWRYRPHVLLDLRHTLYPAVLKPFRFWRYLIRPPRSARHMHERHWQAVRAQVPLLKRPLSSENPAPLHFSRRDHMQADQIWKRWQIPDNAKAMMICPGARSHIKRWTADGFAALADDLIRSFGFQVVFSGEPEEKPIIEDILRQMENPAHMAVGLTTIRQTGLLMQRMRAVVTNDSASLHLASLLDVPVVALFGPTDEDKYGPWGGRGVVVRKKLFCSPCEKPQCRYNHECMRFVQAAEVLQALRGLIQSDLSR